MTLDITSLLLGFAIGALALLAYFLPKLARHRQDYAGMSQSFDAMAQDALRKSQEQFLTLAAEKLKFASAEGSHDLEKRQKAIAELVDPIGKSLKDMEARIEGLGKTGAGLEAQLKNFAEDQRHLREQTQNLVQVLRNPASRGKWGEMQLQRAFELIGFVEGVHFKSQKSAGTKTLGDTSALRPDFVISLPNGIQIVIDVKTPLDPYWHAVEHTDAISQEQDLAQFRQKVRDHLKALSSKDYWRQFESPEFVVMFLPSESLYSLAVGNDHAILEEAAKHNIILASPTTVMGLLRVVMYGWQQQKVAEEAKTISALASDLYRRISVFGEHMGKLGKNLATAVGAYNSAMGSMEQMVLPAMRKFRDLHVSSGGKELPKTDMIDALPRPVTSQELSEFTGDGADIIPLKNNN